MSAFRSGARAAVSAALLIFGVGSAALAQDAAPASGTLSSGVVYEVRPDRAQPAAAIALWYRAPAAGFEGTPLPGLSRLAAATVAGSTPVTGTPLGRLVERYGGRIAIAAFPSSVSITALVPADRVAQTVRAMTGDYFAPVVTADGLRLAQRDAQTELLYRSYEPEAIEDALGAALFATGPLHDGTLGNPDALGAATLDRVRAYAERAFRPANAILVMTGNVDPAVLRDVASRPDGAGAAPEQAAPQTPRSAASGPLAREGNIAGTGLGWIGPPIADETAATALDFASDALFAPRTGIVAKALGARKAAVSGKFLTYRSPGIFLVTITGADAAAARPIVDEAIAGAAKPMPQPAFEAARARFVYHLLSQMATPSDVSDVYGWYAVEGAPAYAPAEGGTDGRYFTLAAKLTPAAVAAVVSKYLTAPPAVVTLARPAPVASPSARPTPAAARPSGKPSPAPKPGKTPGP
ncbi:MAG TPA: insulinase family protein [Candidatus Elarobacter sp.]|nr:insulinase family protein [Candidatus Elarobacter sp.]